MHLPDGFLDTPTAVASAAAAAGGVAIALREVRETIPPRRMPLLGLSAAFIFAAQMLNFPVVGGTSGHLMGGVLAAVLLGPGGAILVLTCVLIVQCLMFADGGLLALGANVFNIAIVSVGVGWGVFRLVRRAVPMEARRSTVFAAAFAGWCSTVAASIACAGELALSGTAPWSLTFPAMANIHMVIGVGEGVITALVLHAVMRARPDLLGASSDTGGRHRSFAYLTLVTAGLVVFVAPFASPWPDGLSRVAAQLGFDHLAAGPAAPAPFPGYAVPFVGSPSGATALAGLVGALLAFAAAYLLARVIVPSLALQPPHDSVRR